VGVVAGAFLSLAHGFDGSSAPSRRRKLSKYAEEATPATHRGLACHGIVTTSGKLGELLADGMGHFSLVRVLSGALRDNRIRPMSDWGQVVAGSNPVSPTLWCRKTSE
jgi:hypothetical protein